jgi:hypothetical protein
MAGRREEKRKRMISFHYDNHPFIHPSIHPSIYASSNGHYMAPTAYVCIHIHPFSILFFDLQFQFIKQWVLHASTSWLPISLSFLTHHIFSSFGHDAQNQKICGNSLAIILLVFCLLCLFVCLFVGFA